MEHLNHSFHLSKLIIKSFQQELNETEKTELSAWLDSNVKNQELYHTLLLQDLTEKKQQIQQLHPDKNWKQLESRIKFRPKPRYLSILKYAAIVTLTLAAGILFYQQHSPTDPQNHLTATTVSPVPGNAKAILTLASGEKVELTNGQDFYLQQDSTIQLANHNNILKIKINNSLSIPTESHSTLSVPKGGEYQLVLSDGSKVWLNSDSKLRFPSPFTGAERTVFLEGEAYFEVAHNPDKPFIVSTGDMAVQVLGTKFNVKAYAGDNAVYTTLVSGSVKAGSRQSTKAVILTPNEQCIYTPADDRIKTSIVDPQAFLGWVKGRFIFENETLEEILKQLGRWYDVEIFYQNPEVAQYRFSGNVDRFEQISTLLRMIEKTYPVSFTINGRTIVVK